MYEGTPTAQIGTYTSTYCISDTTTGGSILVDITIQIHGSNEARFYQFDLEQKNNPGLKADVIGIIGENTIVLRIPEGTDVTSLQPSIDYGAGMGAQLPSGYWNGSKHNFTNPVIYTLTAPDGVTKKQYTVSVEFVPAGSSGGTNPGGNTGNTGGNTGSTGGGTGSTGGSTDSGTGSSGSGTGNTGGSTGSGTGSSGGSTGGGTGATTPTQPTTPSQPATPNRPSTPSQPAASAASGASSSNPQVAYPAVGRVVKSGGAYYRIIASNGMVKSVELKGLVKKKTSTFKIPATVKVDGYIYQVTSIGNKAFMNNKYLKKITIGKYVTSIGTYAFRGCKKLASVTIPNSVVTIGNGAFYQCTSLKKVVIGKSLQMIGKNAFQGCKNLRTLTIQSKKLRSVGKAAVKGVYKRAVIRVPKNKVKAYKKLFNKKTGFSGRMTLRK